MTDPLFYSDREATSNGEESGGEQSLDAILSRYASDMKSGTHLEQKHQQAIKEIEGLLAQARGMAVVEELERLQQLSKRYPGFVPLANTIDNRLAELKEAK